MHGRPAHLARFDDLLISPMRDSERRDLLEVLEDRYDRSATVINQVLTKGWYEMVDVSRRRRRRVRPTLCTRPTCLANPAKFSGSHIPACAAVQD